MWLVLLLFNTQSYSFYVEASTEPSRCFVIQQFSSSRNSYDSGSIYNTLTDAVASYYNLMVVVTTKIFFHIFGLLPLPLSLWCFGVSLASLRVLFSVWNEMTVKRYFIYTWAKCCTFQHDISGSKDTHTYTYTLSRSSTQSKTYTKRHARKYMHLHEVYLLRYGRIHSA